MTNDPIVIITDAIRDNSGASTPMLARVVVDHLADGPIVANAVQALIADGWREGRKGPNGQSEQSDEDLANIARTVLRSVGGA